MWQGRENDGATCGEGTRGRVLSFENDEDNELKWGMAARSCCTCCSSGLVPMCNVCADSYFASVQAACCLFDLNFWFIGLVKTATKMFPKLYLGKVELLIHGTVAAVHDKVELLVFAFCNPLTGQMCYCKHKDKWH
jgi:hypothetical protein